MNEQKIKQILEDHEERIKRLEGKKVSEKIEVTKAKTEDFKGLAGGIRLLIKNNFFNEPKSLNEIIVELKREGYHNSKARVASTLSVTFTKSQKVLNRIKEDKVWKYVLRK